ncbi:RNA polymerase III subunit RPC82-domain-containing protein [Podospora aff. communis PSN243]|uniref:DNA-directed RNA polymerase III subunit RPC3 n=1 Tax=Podospora aff. communis PSN243 TaxID=3040156 RepID=A0AAV9GV30_9PEZI|nr:RNA polymerase III subunit RPC82-domain-containing protein [Podospora aff. communis PSN243]
MQVTQNCAELCALLINELHGELPSRIFAVLLSRGRASLPQICQYTSMTPIQSRHGVAVLLQQNLLYCQVEDGRAMYEANAEFAYNLVRIGKILEMIETSFGLPAKEVMQSLLVSGQTRVADLVAAYREKIDHLNAVMQQHDDEDFPDPKPNGVNGHAAKKADAMVKSTAQLNSVICRLVEAGLIDVVHSKTFHIPADIVKAVETEVTEKYFPAGVKGGRGKIEFQEKMAEALRKVRSESKSLKRKLEQNGTAVKRRKLFAGIGTANGTKGASNGIHEEELDPALDPQQVIRINYEKCLVDLRNRRLVQSVSETIGETTSYVYGVLLRLLTKQLPRCRLDPAMDLNQDGEELEAELKVVTTAQILDNLKTAVDLSLGFGKPPIKEVSSKAAEKISELPPKAKLFIAEAEVDGDASADESDEDSGSDESNYDSDFKEEPAPAINGTKVTFADGDNKPWQQIGRPGQLRQHLLLLAESSQRFVRHCGKDEWTVDFEPLMRTLREAELDAVVERTSGRQGLRLVRILRANGKLDEKALMNIALMSKAEVQQKTVELQKAGYVQIQEVPRDNKSDVKKSFFLWFCDVDRSYIKLMDESYKSMVRCLQVLEVLRQKEKDVLMLTKRTDVKGREKDVMRKEYFDRYFSFQESERKLFTQVMRLDDLVALLRDF